jgi:hypothetical protein
MAEGSSARFALRKVKKAVEMVRMVALKRCVHEKTSLKQEEKTVGNGDSQLFIRCLEMKGMNSTCSENS